jgi:hypothetical protein
VLEVETWSLVAAGSLRKERLMPATDKPNGFRHYEIADAIAASNRVNSTAKLIAYRLARHANSQDGTCNPKVNTLAVELSLSKRAVEDGLRNLVNAGCLLIEHGRGNRSSYYLSEPSAEPRETVVPDTRETVVPEPRETVVPNVNAEVELRKRTSSNGAAETQSQTTSIDDEAHRLAAYVEAKTGKRPAIRPTSTARLAALKAEHGAQNCTAAVDWCIEHWPEPITTDLNRFAGAFTSIRQQMADEEPVHPIFRERIFG